MSLESMDTGDAAHRRIEDVERLDLRDCSQDLRLCRQRNLRTQQSCLEAGQDVTSMHFAT